MNPLTKDFHEQHRQHQIALLRDKIILALNKQLAQEKDITRLVQMANRLAIRFTKSEQKLIQSLVKKVEDQYSEQI